MASAVLARQAHCAPPTSTLDAVSAAHRSIRAASGTSSLPRLYKAFRWSEAIANGPGLSDEKVDALADQTAALWGLIAKQPITSRADALVKLECVVDSFDRGERLDGTDESMLFQVIAWLRFGGLN